MADVAPDAVTARLARLAGRPVVLGVRGLGRSFDGPKGRIAALHDISFETRRREFLCVVGPSGCGKSTLVRALAGLEAPDAGEILVEGQKVRGPGPDRGMVFQSPTLFPWLSVKRNVMFGLLMQGQGRIEAERAARQWLELVGLAHVESHAPHQLSGGMKQRVAIARALATQPRVLLMDEPFSALDAQTRGRMQSYLMEVWRKIPITVVFVTHDLDEAVLLADRILVLAAGPGRIQEVIEVPLARPREAAASLRDPAFVRTRDRLQRLIAEGSMLAGGDEPALPVIPRLSGVDDDVG